jgi:hypothetical protein
MSALAVLPQRWETRVIHLNIANDPPGAPLQGGAHQEPAPTQNPVFSETYLKQEFPDHYSPPQQPGLDQSQHPAAQLQSFINGLGQEGWEFVGVFPISQLVMMFFRRPLPEEPQPTEQAPVDLAEQAPADSVEQSVQDLQPLLQQILQRLEALEGSASLPQQSQEPQPALRTSRTTRPRTAASLTSSRRAPVRVLNPLQRQQLPPEPSLPTLHAATALGLRSPGGLSDYGARHGFPPGLVKLVSNGMAAVYLGTEKRQSGGKLTRLWKVMPQTALPPQ